MIKDGLILDRLREDGKLKDMELLNKIEEVLRKRRVLDKKPAKLKMSTKATKQLATCGLRSTFISTFNNIYVPEFESEVAIIDLTEVTHREAPVPCDYCVFAVLHTLILIGLSKNEEIIEAIRELFLEISTAPTSYISKQQMYMILTKAREHYYSCVLCDTILELIYTAEDRLRYHILERLRNEVGNIQYFTPLFETYKDKTVKEFDKIIKRDAKEYRKCEYRIFEYRENELSIVARTLIEPTTTVDIILSNCIDDSNMRREASKHYDSMTPKAFADEIRTTYKKKHRKKVTFEEMVRVVCG